MGANIRINIVPPGDPTPIDPVVPNTGLFTHGIGAPEATILLSVILILAIAGIVLATYTYRKHKKAGKATKLVRIVEQTKTIIKNKKRTTAGLAALSLLVSACTFTAFMLNANNNNTNAEEATDLTVTANDADLTIELGGEPVFAVLPVEVTVEEATGAGYTLTAYTDNTDLVSTTDGSKVIPMVAADEGELVALADNTYGLSLVQPEDKDNEVYTTLSTDQSNPTIIKSIDDYSPTLVEDKTTIYYGFYITPDTPYGTYTSSDIYYNATTNSSKVIFNGNGLYFNNNPEQATNDVEYITGITDKTAKYSHTPNVNDEGEASGIVGYHSGSDILNKVITIPGASKISIKLSYGGGYISGGYPAGFVSFWQGSHPDYTTGNNIDTAVKTCGTSDVTDGKFYGDRNNENAIITTECELEGNAATFAYWAQGGGPSQGAIYGYYAVITGYDADGNIIYLPGNTQVGGEYKDPAQDLPYIFLGWNEDKKATTATYESKNDIELNLPLTKGDTTELYAIWQHATKIHFDGNGSTSGEIPDKLLAPGKGTNLCGYYYTRDGYIFNNWNTQPDGSGVSYGNCDWYTAPTDQSIELTLYAQWIPATTIIYDGNGGEGSGPTQTIRAGETGNIYGNWGYFSKDGYAFSHWNTKPDGSGETYYEGNQFTAPGQSTTITLYAQWIPATTIIYDGNGGEGSGPTQTIRAGETGNIYGNWGYFSKDGYAFSHWNTKPDGSGITYNTYDSFTASDQSTVITLYAQWARLTTITFNGNGSDGGSGLEDRSLAPGEGTSFCNYDNYTRTGYYFLGWNTEPDGSGTFYANCAWYQAPSDRSETITLYAQWSPVTTIVYDGNGGEGSGPTQTIRAGETGNIYGNWGYFNKDGYVFSHWNTKPDGNGETYYEGNQFTAPDQSITITLYAQWARPTTITFNGNGSDGGSGLEDRSLAPGEGTSFCNYDNYTRTGYYFLGWNTEPDGSGTFYANCAWYQAPSDRSETITLYAQWTDKAMLDTGTTVNAKLKRLAGNSSAEWHTEDTNITTIARASDLPADFVPTDDNIISVDGSIIPVYAWYDTDTATIYYYTESDEIIMNPNSSHMFYKFTSLSDAASIADWDTSNVTNMQLMFDSTGCNATTFYLDLSSWDTSNVTNMSNMFSNAGYNATTFYLDLSSWDTSNVTDMNWMFYYAGYNATTFSLDLSSWDTSNVTNMSQMFRNAGYNATTWSIGDLSSWDTPKVTNMSSMFSGAGHNATTFSLDLSSWDTSNVTNMSSMFHFAGSNATTWSIGDLSTWDTTRVTNMQRMFYNAGYNATTWSIGDLSTWDTSNVTNISYMFSYAGSKATTWSIGDLSSWDTSNVTNMNNMFEFAGSNATTWSIGDLSSWDTSNVTDMNNMFYYAGSNATTWSIGDLSSWDTSNVTDMSGMFTRTGSNATTWSIGDLSSWDTSNVTDMNNMFFNAGFNATTFSLDLSSWDTSKVTNMGGMFDSTGYNATTWSIGDLSSWDTSNVTNMNNMFDSTGYNATTWSIGDLSTWNTSNVTNISLMFFSAGSNATTFSLDLSSWDTSNVTDMNNMFHYAGSNATTFSLDLSSWDTSKVTNMGSMFTYAGYSATTWSITIPPKTGDINNTTSAFYGQNSSIYANPPNNKFFTLAVQANPNTANTTGSLNSVNNMGAPTQDVSSENRSAYTTEDTENTENVDNTSPSTTSTPSRQEPLGEHQNSATVSTEDTDIVIPILIAASVALGTSALGLLIYKSHRREDE